LLTLQTVFSYGQQDSIIPSITQIPLQFVNETNKKIDKYSQRITNKTEKTLDKLTKLENRIHKLLLKANPAVAEQLFGEGRETFASMLAKIKEGKSLAENYKAKYNEYSDKLSTNISFIETQRDQLSNKYILPLKKTKQKITQLEKDVAETETAERIIKERTKLLLQEAYKVLGKNRLLNKIGAENYYFAESIRNYKEIFQDSKQAEKLAFDILNKIPAVKEFVQQNSMLASLFGSPSSGGSTASLAGLQTRASVNNLIQGRIAAGGPNAAAQISANMQAAQAELGKLKDKIIKAGGGSSNGELPDFKPKDVKSQTFKQRLEYNTNFNISKPSVLQPNTADVAFGIGYKITNKSIIGIGASYKMGFGSIQAINITGEGVGLRSYINHKLKKNFFVTGGYEMNYNSAFKNLNTLQDLSVWNSSGLVGLSKKVKVKTKLFKETTFQLLYDMLHRNNTPVKQALIFRVGYGF
jgi:hypothetical protein